VRGFEQMLQRFLARYKQAGAETGELTFADVEVVPLGDEHALVRGHWFVDFAQKPDQGGLFSLVFERQGAGWRILHDHTSLAAPPAQTVQ
jgi:ketosteroid isomerase-like protein